MQRSLLRSFTTGKAIGLMICNLLLPGLLSSAQAGPLTGRPVAERVCVPATPLQSSDEAYMQILNQNIYAELFGVEPADAEMIRLADEPTTSGLYTADAGSGRTLVFEIADPVTIETDPTHVEMSKELETFVTGTNFVARVVCGVVESETAAFYAGALVFSMDTPDGRRHVVAFGSYMPYSDQTVYMPDDQPGCAEDAPGAGPQGVQDAPAPTPAPTGPDPVLCAQLRQGCMDSYLSSQDTCAAAAILCAAAAVLCIIAIGQAAWWCMVTGLTCAALAWLINTCARGLALCIAGVAACYANAEIAYNICMNRVRNHPACQGIYEH